MGARLSLVFILICGAFLALSAAQALAQTPTVTVQTASVTVGKTVQVPITLSAAPNGLSSFALTVNLSNGNIADITDVIWPDIFKTTGVFTISPDHSTVTLLANDSTNAVQTGATKIKLAQLVIQGKAAGSGEIVVQSDQLKDDAGALFEVNPQNGYLSVAGEADPPPVFADAQPAPNATVTTAQPTIAIKITDVGSGVDPSTIQLRIETGAASHSFNVESPGASWDGTTFAINLQEAAISLPAGEVNVWVTAADKGKHIATTTWSFTVQPATTSIAAAVAAHSGDPQVIEDADILWAIDLWIEGAEVPGTGQKISDQDILDLIDLWIAGTPVGS